MPSGSAHGSTANARPGEACTGGGMFSGQGPNPGVGQYVNSAANVHVRRQFKGMCGWKVAMQRTA